MEKLRSERSSNLELLRIVAMFIIIVHHCCYYGGFNPSDMPFSASKILIQSLSLGGFGINLFVLVSGYFMVSTGFKMRRLVKTWLQIAFYSLFLFILMASFGAIQFDFISLIKAAIPVAFEQYWFATTYVILICISPFLNILIKAMNKRTHLILVLVLILLQSVLPTITTAKMAYADIAWFVALYFIAAYLRLYPNSLTMSLKKSLAILFCSMSFLVISVIFIDVLAINDAFFKNVGVYMLAQNKLPMLIASISMFLVFNNIKSLGSNKIINTIAGTTFGIYLIHDSSAFRVVLWRNIFRPDLFPNTLLLPVYIFAAAAFVFLIGMGIDFLRQYLLEKPMFFLYDNRCIRLKSFFARAGEKGNAIIDKISEYK
ncbi:MAG: acyltransferase [Clostridia bacterium]